jgi:hypothetical protein
MLLLLLLLQEGLLEQQQEQQQQRLAGALVWTLLAWQQAPMRSGKVR